MASITTSKRGGFHRLIKRQATPSEYLVMTILALLTMLPIVYMVSTSFKPLEEMFLYPPRFLVRHPTLRNFAELVLAIDSFQVPFARYLFNSLLVATVTAGGSVILSSL